MLRPRVAALLIGAGFGGGVAALGQNAPSLTITGPTEPQIAVQGMPGANYQLQYASNLTDTNWNSLTNFTMGAGPFAIVDHGAVSNQIRFYRALVLNAAPNTSYAPEIVAPGELFQFKFSSSGFPTGTQTEYLALNNETNGLLLRQNTFLGSNPLVGFHYQRSGNFSAQVIIVEPASLALPLARTNFYNLYFVSPNSGFYQGGDGVTQTQTGLFTRDASLVGLQPAAATVLPGQIFKLGETNFDAVSIVIDSTTNGVAVRNPGSSELLTSVELRYEKLGPAAYQLTVIVPSGQPATNTYWGIYQSPASGIFNQFNSSALGTFLRNDAFTGPALAPLALQAGEIYSLSNLIAGPTSILVNNPSNALLVARSAPPTAPGIFPVNINSSAVGPLHSRLEVVLAPNLNNPTAQTNLYTFVYTTTNSGTYQLSDLFGGASGTFIHDRSLVGQSIASTTLSAGEVFSLKGSNNGILGGAVIVMNSPSSGSLSWLPPSSSLEAGIFPATIQYTWLGPLGAKLEIKTFPPGGVQEPITNVCYLAYVSTNSGLSQGLINQIYSPSGLGSFSRSQTLIGQQLTQAQLSAGEIYEMTMLSTPGSTSNILTMMVTAPTNGLAFWETPVTFSPDFSGLTTVALNYVPLNSREFQLEVVFPPSDFYPQAVTNFCTFVYSATNSGLLQVTNGPQPAGGIFRRQISLVGQPTAPLQLTAGESYGFSTSNNVSAVADILLVDSTNSGVLLTQGTGPNSGLFPNTSLDFLRLNDFSAQITAVIPPLPPLSTEARTNSYWLIYTATNAGLVKRSSAPLGNTLGRFQRQPVP